MKKKKKKKKHGKEATTHIDSVVNKRLFKSNLLNCLFESFIVNKMPFQAEPFKWYTLKVIRDDCS